MKLDPRQLAAIAAFALAAGCGDNGGGSPTTPSGGPPPTGATITIGINGAVRPAEVTVNIGQSVTFVNDHDKSHDIASDPHPAHTDCPAVNTVGRIAAGQTRSSGAFTGARTCGFHDHDNPENAALRGRIVVR